jgi:hypothetical protein
VKVDLKKMEGMEEEELKTYFMKCCESVEEEKEEDIPDAVSDLYNELVKEDEAEEVEEEEETPKKKDKKGKTKKEKEVEEDEDEEEVPDPDDDDDEEEETPKKKKGAKEVEKKKPVKGKEEKKAPAKKEKAPAKKAVAKKKEAKEQEHGITIGTKSHKFMLAVKAAGKKGISMGEIKKQKWNDGGAAYNGTLSILKGDKLVKTDEGKMFWIGGK